MLVTRSVSEDEVDWSFFLAHASGWDRGSTRSRVLMLRVCALNRCLKLEQKSETHFRKLHSPPGGLAVWALAPVVNR